MGDVTGLDDGLRAVADSLEVASRSTTAAQAMTRTAPIVAHRGRARVAAVGVAVAALATALAVTTVFDGIGRDRVETERSPVTQPTAAPSTTVPAQTTTSLSRQTVLTGVAFDQLPEAGVAVVEDEQLVLLSFDGTELGRGPALSPEAVQQDLSVVVSFDRVARLVSDGVQAPAGCEGARAAGGVRVALCGREPQVRDRIDRIDHLGRSTTVAGVVAGVGHWRGAMPSPDGRWVLGQWSAECEVPIAYLIPAHGGAPVPVAEGDSGTLIESKGLGWTPDGRMVMSLPAGPCSSGGDPAGVYLIDPDTLERTLVRAGGAPALMWSRQGGFPNDPEVTIQRARRELGLEGCCGEPSHGGDGALDGVTWEGIGVGVAGNPAGFDLGVEFTGSVSTPTVAGGDAVMGDTAEGVVVAFTCGGVHWTVGGGLSDHVADEATVLAVAEALIPHLYCTLADPPMVASSTERPDEG